MLVFQQRTTTLALNVIIDLLLPVTGQEHPYPPSLQQKLIQLADRMREAESFSPVLVVHASGTMISGVVDASYMDVALPTSV